MAMERVVMCLFLLGMVSAIRITEFQQKGNRENLGRPNFCNGLDCPKFTVVKNATGYQERRYEASEWVTTELTGVDYKKAGRQMFMTLFGYIQGDNSKNEKIKMTAPVKTRIIPGEGPACESNFTMSFFVAPNQSPAPKPKAMNTYVEKVESQSFYVIEFGGFTWDFEAWSTQAKRLHDLLERDNVNDYEKEYYFTCGYDSPFKLWNRHNEVWFIKK